MEFDIMSALGSLGFPIVMSLLLYRYMTDEQQKTREVLNDLKQTIFGLQTMMETIIKNVSRETYHGEEDEK